MSDQSHKKLTYKTFWDNNPCFYTDGNFQETVALRYRIQPWAYPYISAVRAANPDKKILEVGCGQGIETRFFAENSRISVGIDLSIQSLFAAQRYSQDLDHCFLACANGETLPFTDNAFDIVLSFGVLNHTPDWQKVCHEIKRVLKPDGLFFMHVYRRFSPKGQTALLLRHTVFFIERLFHRQGGFYNWLLRRKESLPFRTALLELFGVPIMKMFTKRELKKKLPFKIETIEIYETGLVQLLAPFLPYRFCVKVDQLLQKYFGFLFVIQMRKKTP